MKTEEVANYSANPPASFSRLAKLATLEISTVTLASVTAMLWGNRKKDNTPQPSSSEAEKQIEQQVYGATTEPLPVGHLELKGESVKAEALPVGHLELKGESVKAPALTPYTEEASSVTVTFDTISDGYINQAEIAQTTRLSGIFTLSTNALNPAINVLINGQSYLAELDIENQVWQLELPTTTLNHSEGEQQIEAEISAINVLGVIATHRASQTYVVDTQIATPIIHFDPIANDDVIDLIEAQSATVNVSGTVTDGKEGDEIILMIGEATYKAVVSAGRFVVPVDTKTLVVHQEIRAILATQDLAGNRATATQSKSYQVDTVTGLPEITLEQITSDNTINIVEASRPYRLQGSVRNAEDGSLVRLTIGDATFETVVTGGVFSQEVSGELLAKHRKVDLAVTNTFNLSRQATHAYDVDLEAPTAVITLDKITGDNLITAKEASDTHIAVTGKVEGVEDGKEITVSCGCSTCSGVQWVDIVTRVQNGEFKVNFASTVLTASGNNMIKATLTQSDEVENQATYEASQIYSYNSINTNARIGSLSQVDKLSAIGVDNVLNQAFINNNPTVTLTGIIWGNKIYSRSEVIENVVILLGEKQYPATLSLHNGVMRQFSVTLPTTDLKPYDKLSLMAVIRDSATGNKSTISNSLTYQYDDDVAISLSIDDINEHNLLNQASLAQEITLSGDLNYDSNDIDVEQINLVLSVNNQEYTPTIDGNRWLITLPAIELSVEGN